MTLNCLKEPKIIFKVKEVDIKRVMRGILSSIAILNNKKNRQKLRQECFITITKLKRSRLKAVIKKHRVTLRQKVNITILKAEHTFNIRNY